MGLDIKTYGRINVPVYASDDGYIERVRVSGTGYGKALYLKHNDGYKSVYAHLNSFHKEIEKYDITFFECIKQPLFFYFSAQSV